MNNLCIIPARGGSKRIPRKNIRDFAGRPIISYPVEIAISSNLFTEVMVSTDDFEIANIAREYGAHVPFMRSSENSGDFAGLLEVIGEVITGYSKMNKAFDSICCILPTSPLLRSEALHSAYKLFAGKDFDSVFPIVKYDYPIQRSLYIDQGRAILNWPENYSKRSQDLSPNFHDVGQFYWINFKRCESYGAIFTNNTGVIELSSLEVQDIDSEQDWSLAELKYRLYKNL